MSERGLGADVAMPAWGGWRHMVARAGEWALGPPDHLADQLVDDVDRDTDDMRLITRHAAGPDVLLPERLALAGVDEADLVQSAPVVMAELEDACRACPHWRRCARDLANGVPTCIGYCANAARLASLAG